MERYDWMNGTYDITKNGERVLIDDVIEMLYELDKLQDENKRMVDILLKLNDPDTMMNGMSAALSWQVSYAMEHPEIRARYGRSK